MLQAKFYVMLPQRNFAKTRSLAEAADSLGYHGVGLSDHFFVHRGDLQVPDEPLLECYTALGAIAAVTKRVMMTQVVTANSFRNPALLAKMTSTLDQISGGRFELRIGSGWFREEYEAYGYPYPSNAERIDQLEEALKSSRRCGPKMSRASTDAITGLRKRTTFPSRSRSRIRG